MPEITVQQIVFIVVSAITLGAAIVVVTNRNLFHAALAMMLSFLGVAGMYALLESGFLAASQLIIYIGAISILIIFAIMMTRRIMQTTESPFNAQWVWSLLAATFFFAGIAFVVIRIWGDPAFDTAPAVPTEVLRENVVTLGLELVSSSGYVVPFEVISLLLLAALVGSIAIARPEEE